MQRPAEDRGDASRAPEEDPEQHSGHEAADEPDAPGSGLTAGDSALERTEGTCQPGSVCGAARLPDSPFPRRSSASDARLGQAGPGRPAPDRRHPCREGARLFVPCPGAARQRRSLHIEDGLWDGDGTSRFPPCLGAHRFEELFCFLDFFSPCSPRPESSPSPRPRGHRLLTPSAESVRRVRSLPRPRTPHGGSRGEAEPPAAWRRCQGRGCPAPDNHFSPPRPRGPSARGSALERVRREGFAPFLLGFARQNPNPVRFYYAGS